LFFTVMAIARETLYRKRDAAALALIRPAARIAFKKSALFADKPSAVWMRRLFRIFSGL